MPLRINSDPRTVTILCQGRTDENGDPVVGFGIETEQHDGVRISVVVPRDDFLDILLDMFHNAAYEAVSHSNTSSRPTKHFRGTDHKWTHKPTITPELVERFRVADKKDGEVFHILIDDNNVDHGSARFCLEQAEKRGDPEVIALAKILVRMSKTQRLKIANLVTAI